MLKILQQRDSFMQHFTQNLAGSQPVFITQRQLPDDENACNSARFSELRKQLVAATRRFQPKQSQGLAEDVVFRVIDKWWAWEERKNRTDAGLRYPDTPIPNHGVMDDPVIYACVRQYAELAVATSGSDGRLSHWSALHRTVAEGDPNPSANILHTACTGQKTGRYVQKGGCGLVYSTCP